MTLTPPPTPPPMPNLIFTFGHSTTPLPEAVRFLRAAGITLLVDVRSHPGSARCPWWGRDQLEKAVPDLGLAYLWAPGLGGWSRTHLALAPQFLDRGVDVAEYAGKFPKHRIAKKRWSPTPPLFGGPDVGPTWDNLGLWDYSWFMTLPEFQEAADHLVELASYNLVAIFCAELLWWRCHRSMIADYLAYRGHQVIHLQPKLTDHLIHAADRVGRYHPDIRHAWARWELGTREEALDATRPR